MSRNKDQMGLSLKNSDLLIQISDHHQKSISSGENLELGKQHHLYIVNDKKVLDTLASIQKKLIPDNTPLAKEAGLWKNDQLFCHLVYLNHRDSPETKIEIEYPFQLIMNYCLRINDPNKFVDEFLKQEPDQETFYAFVNDKLQMTLKRYFDKNEKLQEDDILLIANQFLLSWGLILRKILVEKLDTTPQPKTLDLARSKEQTIAFNTKPSSQTPDIHCSSCKSQIPFNSQFCSQCGTKLKQEPKSCPRCEEKLSAQSKFCHICGYDLIAKIVP